MRTLLIPLLAFSAIASAEAPTPAPSLPKHTCVKPDTQGRLASKNQLKIFANDQKTFRDCLQDFVKAQSALSKLHMDAANAAIKEHNDYVAASGKKPVESQSPQN